MDRRLVTQAIYPPLASTPTLLIISQLLALRLLNTLPSIIPGPCTSAAWSSSLWTPL